MRQSFGCVQLLIFIDWECGLNKRYSVVNLIVYGAT